MLQGPPMSDAPPPPLPQHALIWIVVAALVLALVMARLVLKNGKLVRRAAPRMPKDDAT
jgi:hypothetical protein